MASVYKKFTAQDKALIPFNAHKQYNFTSASAAISQISHYTANHTSESVSSYSSASSDHGGDTINVVKYNQIDHLFYRNYKQKIDSKKDFKNYLKQRRDLYKRANILSIPTGLYGYEIKPNSFYLSASGQEIIDDSFGNLIISGTNINNYPSDIRKNVFRLDPIQGFKKYDLSVFDGYAIENSQIVRDGDIVKNDRIISTAPDIPYELIYKQFYRQGQNNPAFSSSYTTTDKQFLLEKSGRNPNTFDLDDSYFFNKLLYNKVQFSTSSLGSATNKFPTINFNSQIGSHIEIKHDERFNFNKDQDFSIYFTLNPKKFNNQTPDSEKRYIIAKSGTKTIVNSGSHSQNVDSEPHFPYEVYMISQSLYFERSDGETTFSINGEITSSNTSLRTSHIQLQNSASVMQLYFDGNLIASTTTKFKKHTRNTSNLYIGTKGKHNSTDGDGGIGTSAIGSTFIIGSYGDDTVQGKGRFFNGDIGNINIWSKAYNQTQITNISESINGSPYIGNLFYRNGFATITHPKYTNILDNAGVGDLAVGDNFSIGPIGNGIQTLQFQGSHLIYEHEYQCTVQEHEYNSTTNLSARVIPSSTNRQLADFTTSSFFKPFVTTIGLYNEENELLVVGKLGQPIRMSDETDTTFVVRYDT